MRRKLENAKKPRGQRKRVNLMETRGYCTRAHRTRTNQERHGGPYRPANTFNPQNKFSHATSTQDQVFVFNERNTKR